MTASSGPEVVIWDPTYACPLRCIHCYSESGRRPSRQLGHEDMVRVAEALISLKPRVVALGGGEPLLVKGIFEIADQLSRAGIKTSLYTGGWTMQPWMTERLAEFDEVLVSLDGATAAVHDRIRGRPGSFDHALRALELLDSAAREKREERRQREQREQREPQSQPDGPHGTFGIDYVVVRSNFGQLEEFCRTVPGRFPELGTVNFNAAIPAGLASRPEFGDHELLDEEQLAELVAPETVARLQAAVPETVGIFTSDNLVLQMHPDRLAAGEFAPVMQVEPDGEVRGMPIYEGTVGSLLDEEPHKLWARSLARWHDRFVVETLTPVRTMRDWAAAVRRIDYHFGSPEVRARIDRRKPLPLAGEPC
ncbi:radical SAM protein [Streptomyces sp. NPDC093544]|uniref:radical SAM protein n=1 Tax=Streptomyces sp. NPDC093544 TaxID=3155200 RepID=UPI003418A7CC